jgi:N-carbamoyl-L-amino-acid hydrolase
VIHHPTEFTSAADQAFATQILADMLYAIASEGLQVANPKGAVA